MGTPHKSSPSDQTLFEALRDLRLSLSRTEKVPPFVIFSDKSLREMSILKPVSRSAFLTVTGVGQYKADKYGEAFTALIQSHRTPPSGEEPEKP